MSSFKDIFQIATDLSAVSEKTKDDDVLLPMKSLEDAASQLKRSFSGSWLGYHAYTYYEDFSPSPAGAVWSQEWGNYESFANLGSRGNWVEYTPEYVRDYIYRIAGNPDISPAQDAAEAAVKLFENSKAELTSIISLELKSEPDSFIGKLLTELEKITPLSANQVVQAWKPQGQIMTRDQNALGQGFLTPPHIQVLAEMAALNHSFNICIKASEIAQKVASHMERKSQRHVAEKRVGTNVFLGHGRSAAWRELKDFIQERLSLPCDEFNRVPVAGVTNIARLSQMLDAAAFAFLIMTAEDETVDGKNQARMNVVHEVGLFQGRLGFEKAIVLLEEGCEEFSNIQGLGQIRFPKGNIAACFEEIRLVLERGELV
ncbi:TIR domain-containing protein [Terasakiella pusilla]|uniref:TIR domain-containing protein n=1 Tax=Terasakiella pusilla TaxID=64973 RepID=UPI003AA8E127